jgi:hypothetical protein
MYVLPVATSFDIPSTDMTACVVLDTPIVLSVWIMPDIVIVAELPSWIVHAWFS